MNKKELAELKKHFTVDDGLLAVSSVLTAYVDPTKTVTGLSTRPFVEIDADEAELLFGMVKKVLSGSIGKNLVEYAFPTEQYEEDGTQKMLYTLLKEKLSNAETDKAFAEHIAAALHMETTFALITFACTYSVISKARDDTTLNMNDLDYNFLLTAFVPVSAASNGLVIDESGGIALDNLTALTLDNRPSDGFLFPVFSDRAPDVNNVCAYSKNTAKPNVSLIQGVLGCEFVRAAKSEREIFNDVLENAVGNELDYTKIVEIDSKIAEIVAATQNETELALIDAPRLTRILSDTGMSAETVKAVPAAFEKAVGETGLTAVNLVSKKVNLVTEGITVTVSGDSTGRVRTQNVGGRKCLVIDLDDPAVKINGIETTI
jgi:hypothetical protein